jgi:two-component system sensor histidine kinase/response regulator
MMSEAFAEMFTFRNLSIRRKLTWIITIITVTAILLACGAFLSFDIYRLRHSTVNDLETLAQILGSNSTAAMTFDDLQSGREVLQALSAKEHILSACVYRKDGRTFASYTRNSAESDLACPPAETDSSRFERGRLVVFRKVVLDDQPIGTVFLDSDLEELSQLLRWYSTFFVLIVVSLSAGAFFLAARMQRTISDPILSLAETTKLVTTGKDYSIRVRRSAHDEVGVLVDGFNDMLAEIQGRDQELQRAQDELEHRVEDRTAELRQEISVREQTEAALRESEERARLLLDSTAEAIFGVDPEGCCTFCNRATLRLLGYTDTKDLMGRNMHALTHHTRPNGLPYPVENCPISDAVRNGEACHREDELLWRADGTSFPAEYWSHPVQRTDQLVGAVITFVDITERQAAQRVIERAKEAAEAASRAKSEFLANMSHEIRTPMNGIIGMTELTLDTNLTDEQREYLTMVKLSSDSLLVVINDILDFSKIEAGKMELDSSVFSIRESLEETIRSFGITAGEKHVELVCDIHSDLPHLVAGDPIRLRQVVVNMLGNAIKFTDHGEIVLQAQVQQRHDSSVEVHFTVRDTGIGIPKDKQAIIFEAFAQADGSSTRKHGGTGLGLTICTRLVAMMGGRIWLDSEPGKGSTFHFTASFKLAQPSAETSEPEKPGSLEGIPVLIVDDNPTNRRILEMTVLQWGMRPTAVASGWAALAELRRAQKEGQPTPLVLLDSQMPQLDGFATAAKIKQNPDLSTATIMMLTSGGQRGDADRCRQLGISAYLSKPVRQWELREAVLRVLGLRPQRGQDSRLVTRHTLQETPKRLRILLAEDNAVNRELTVRILSKRGHSVEVAVNGKLALEALETHPFDVILMDVQMPEMDGFEATGAIRKREAVTGTRIPIIAMTAHAMKGDRERCLAAGMDAYISKPVQTEELLKITEALAADADPIDNIDESGHAVMDRSLALARVDGDEALLVDLAKLFCEESPKMLAAVQAAVSAKDADRLQRAAHSLKGAVATLAAQKAFDAALRLERLGRAGDLADADKAYAALEAQIERLRSVLETLSAGKEWAPEVETL